ncbi:MAG: response regulator [Chloroflexaceae bacterium]|nr:response regulator [Chloroflexaceae bacterium]NJL33374.1 response regulator [Chloroflexaceae bacterium]NJO07504.1 response regulator [Chloroflexaceae bacterium]NJO84835.1 response regulator [Blastochloris sp.]
MATILLVEDNPIIQRMYSYMLRKKGHTVVIAENGALALRLMEDTPFDLVIADLAMPEMDGLELIGHVRADTRYKGLPIIMLTASGQEEDRERAQAAGANDFLTKPSSSHEFIAAVHRQLAALTT